MNTTSPRVNRLRTFFGAMVLVLFLSVNTSRQALADVDDGYENWFSDSDSLPSAPPNTAELCKELARLRPPPLTETLRALYQVMFVPEKFAAPLIETIRTASPTAPQGLRPNASRKNRIYLYTGEDAEKSDAALRKEMEILDRVENQLRESGEALSHLHEFAAISWVACVNEAEKTRFDVNRFTALVDSRNKLWKAKGVKEAMAVLREIPAGLKEDWEIQTSFDANSLFRDLHDGKVENAVIIAHADANGQIYDSMGNTLPASFFNHLHPSVRSISMFSCHAGKVKKYYRVDEALSAPSPFKNRFFIAPVSGEFLSIQDVVPVQTVGYFLNQVDAWLKYYPIQIGAPTEDPRAQPGPKCSLRFTGISHRSGTGDFAVFVQSDFVGLLEPLMRVSCDLLKETAYPFILVRNLNAFLDSDGGISPEAKVELRVDAGNGTTSVNLSGKGYYRKNGSLMMVRFNSPAQL